MSKKVMMTGSLKAEKILNKNETEQLFGKSKAHVKVSLAATSSPLIQYGSQSSNSPQTLIIASMSGIYRVQ